MVSRVLPSGKDKAREGQGSPVAARAVLAAEAPNLVLVEMRPSDQAKAIVLHLREVEGRKATVAKNELACAARVSRLDEVNVLEETVGAKRDRIEFQPWEAKFVKVSFR